MNLCRKCLINLNKHNVVASVLVQIVLYAILLLCFINKPLDSTQIVITIVIFTTSTIILAISLLFLNEKLKKLSICILQIVFKFIICIMIIFLPSLQLENDTTQVKAYFIGKLIASIQIENPNQSYENLKNKTELVCAVFILIGLSLNQSQQINQQDNILIIILLFSDLITKVLCYIQSTVNGPINKFKIEAAQNHSQIIQIASKNEHLAQDLSQRKMIDSNGQILESSPPVIKQITMRRNSDNFSYQIYGEMLNYFQDGIALINDKKEIILNSPSLQTLTKTNNVNDLMIFLMQLKNCQDEIFKKKNQDKFFDAFVSRASKSSQSWVDFSTKVLKKPQIYECCSLGEAMTQLYERFKVNSTKDILKKNHRSYDFDMFCVTNPENSRQSITSKKEEEKLFQVSIRPFIYNDELYIFLELRDITHQSEIKQLEILNENKSKMMEQVAHEFRTPLNCIILLVQEVMTQINDKNLLKNKSFLEPVLISAQQLLSLIQDLLDIAQLRAGKFHLFYQEFDLLKVINDLKNLLTPNLQLKGNKIVILKENLIPPTIISDPNRIRQVLINLIGNAAKFTSNGIITVGIKSLTFNQIQVYVKDNGIGIDPEDQKKLFKAFAKLENGKNMNAQGVGLGLMISNILAEKLSSPHLADGFKQIGSREATEKTGLTVYSQGKGFGTTFTFIIQNENPNVFSQLSSSSFKSDSKQSQFLLMAQTYKISEIFNDLGNDRNRQQIPYDNSLSDQIPIKKFSSDQTSLKLFLERTSTNQQKQQELQTISQSLVINKYPSIAEYSNKDSIESHISSSNKTCECLEILVIDDEPFNLLVMRTLLTKMNLKIDESANPIEALEKVKSFKCPYNLHTHYRMIFVDLEMPIMDGYETAKQILNIQPDQVLIACSGHSGDQVKNKCLSYGFRDLLEKPIRKNLLEQLIDNYHFQLNDWEDESSPFQGSDVI